MNIITEIIFLILVIYGILRAYKINKEIILHSYDSIGRKIVMYSSIIIFLLIAYKTNEGFKGYVLSILASTFFILFAKAEGLNKEGIIFNHGGRGFNNIKLLKYEDFRVVKIKIAEHIRLEAQSSKGLVIMKFNIKDKEKVFSLIKNVKLEIKE